MTQTRKTQGLSATALRLLAMLSMLLDHAWATVVPGNFWMTCVGRLAFPLFAFQISEGFLHTSDQRKYVKRLLFTAIAAEIPFNLVMSGSVVYPFHQNTIFTLLLGLWAIHALDQARETKKWRKGLGLALCSVLLGAITMVDYGWKGVLTVIVFYLFRDFRGARLCQLVSMFILHCLLMEGQVVPILNTGLELPLQTLALLALIPIWLYDGRKGRGGKAFQYAAYVFYPAHLLLLWLILQLR